MIRDPSVGYYDRQLWLPKKFVNLRSAKAGLEFPVMGEKGIEYLQLWEETADHLIVPREFVPRDTYSMLGFQIKRTYGPAKYQEVQFESSIILDAKNPNKDVQRRASAAFKITDCGILNLACGLGKTVVALDNVARKRVPALIIVNNTTLINQWAEQVSKFLKVPGGVGVVQGPPRTWDWRNRGVVIAMLHTLALRYEELPESFAEYFGGIYYDEAHHLSAEVFSRVCPMFYGERYGLTATTNREDGLELVYQYHIGPVFFKCLLQDLKPEINFQESPLKINTSLPEVRDAITDKNGKPCLPKLRTYIGALEENNTFIASKIKEAADRGRKILVLSHSVLQLQLMHKMFPGSGLCIGEENVADRLTALRTKQITFGTLQLVKEALDEDTIDTEFFITPFGSADVLDGGKNTLQQGMGRALRVRKGKKAPIIVIIDHKYIPKFHAQCNKLKKLLREWPEDEGGPLEFSTVKPYRERT